MVKPSGPRNLPRAMFIIYALTSNWEMGHMRMELWSFFTNHEMWEVILWITTYQLGWGSINKYLKNEVNSCSISWWHVSFSPWSFFIRDMQFEFLRWTIERRNNLELSSPSLSHLTWYFCYHNISSWHFISTIWVWIWYSCWDKALKHHEVMICYCIYSILHSKYF